ncbi:hypothetical protein PVAND_003585 [Polypedilum vanderplanki]|uniref:SURP motif domain-containing protein n=1 Tax=Polypedilum vanderplanki TaxID=319348 RepID=A0A9J6BUH7_POLVA|nr:hypothetical protein PVAND_003585 [Polypedilum vanderplanki]
MTSKSGILKTKSNYEHRSAVDFLVFGYQCKLYRDDKKALEIDRETHLIPAPYEPKDLISRYDVRTTLSEIAPYECSSSVLNRFDGLSAAEQQAELLAEKERYFSLYINEVEEELYKEEEIKRQTSTSGYNQVQFSYDDDDDNAKNKIGPKESSDVPQDNENDDNDSDDTPFTPAENLKIPSNIKIPTTVKLNQIIEKTAKFIASQGLQMEILLKTKQASNPQFNFLNHDGEFNSYYKHILSMMKNNTYPWQELQQNSNLNQHQSETSNSNDTNENVHTAIIIPKMQYKPSHDCYYTQLISKITKAPISELERKQQEEEDANKVKNNDSNVPKISSGLLGLSNYNSDSESNDENEDDADNNENDKFNGVVPPSNIQKVIDTTAVYVAKNGAHFEQKLMEKIHTDTRFEFLHEDNKYHAYYKMKVKSYLPNNTNITLGTINKSSNPSTTIKSVTTIEPTSTPNIKIDVPKTPPAPVCFSIKTKEERPPLKNSRIDNSDDEKNSSSIPDAPSPPRITTVEEELERQVDIINAEREEKLIKERLNEKLLSAAREKLGMLPKEKMLQIERKKRAMMFINQIKGSNGSSSNSGNKKEDDVINLTLCGEESNDSAKSISSLLKRNYSNNKNESRSRSRKKSRSRSSSSSSRSRSYSSRSSDSSPRRKRSKKHKSKSKKKHRRSTRSRSRSKSSSKKYSKR